MPGGAKVNHLVVVDHFLMYTTCLTGTDWMIGVADRRGPLTGRRRAGAGAGDGDGDEHARIAVSLRGGLVRAGVVVRAALAQVHGVVGGPSHRCLQDGDARPAEV